MPRRRTWKPASLGKMRGDRTQRPARREAVRPPELRRARGPATARRARLAPEPAAAHPAARAPRAGQRVGWAAMAERAALATSKRRFVVGRAGIVWRDLLAPMKVPSMMTFRPVAR